MSARAQIQWDDQPQVRWDEYGNRVGRQEWDEKGNPVPTRDVFDEAAKHQGDVFDRAARLQDKDFQSANRVDQHRYVSSIDPDYAKASPEDQMAYLNRITGKPAPTTANNSVESKTNSSEPEGFWGAAYNDAKWAVEGLGRTIVRPYTEAYEGYKHGGIAEGAARGLNALNTPLGEPISPSEILERNQRQKASAYGLPYRVASGALGAAGIMNSKSMEDAAARGDAAGVLGHTVVPVATVASPLLGEGAAAARGALGDARLAIARNIYTPEGGLTPGANALMHPMKFPEYLGRKAFPEPPEQIARRQADEYYGQRGEDLMRRGEEQSTIDAANEQRLRDVESARQKELADTERLREQHARSLAQTAARQATERASTAEAIIGSIARPSGRIVLTPEEVTANDRMLRLAKTRASEHGLQYAAGMRPAGGGRVPMTPTGTEVSGYAPVRPRTKWGSSD
jgi:hypothetical protein